MNDRYRPKLHYGKLKEADHAYRRLFAEVPSGVDIDTVLNPDFWAHYTRDIRPMDVIEVFCEDGSWEGVLRVMSVGTVEVKVKLRSVTEYETDEEPEVEDDLYWIRWKGPAAKFAVVNKESGETIKDHLYPKSEAYAFMRSHLQSMRH